MNRPPMVTANVNGTSLVVPQRTGTTIWPNAANIPYSTYAHDRSAILSLPSAFLGPSLIQVLAPTPCSPTRLAAAWLTRHTVHNQILDPAGPQPFL